MTVFHSINLGEVGGFILPLPHWFHFGFVPPQSSIYMAKRGFTKASTSLWGHINCKSRHSRLRLPTLRYSLESQGMAVLPQFCTMETNLSMSRAGGGESFFSFFSCMQEGSKASYLYPFSGGARTQWLIAKVFAAKLHLYFVAMLCTQVGNPQIKICWQKLQDVCISAHPSIWSLYRIEPWCCHMRAFLLQIAQIQKLQQRSEEEMDCLLKSYGLNCHPYRVWKNSLPAMCALGNAAQVLMEMPANTAPSEDILPFAQMHKEVDPNPNPPYLLVLNDQIECLCLKSLLFISS